MTRSETAAALEERPHGLGLRAKLASLKNGPVQLSLRRGLSRRHRVVHRPAYLCGTSVHLKGGTSAR